VSVCVLLSLHYEFQMSPKEQLPVNVDLVGTVFQVPIRKRDFKSYIFENVKMLSVMSRLRNRVSVGGVIYSL